MHIECALLPDILLRSKAKLMIILIRLNFAEQPTE